MQEPGGETAAEAWRISAESLALHFLCGLLSYATQDHVPRDGTTHNRLDLQHLSLIRKMPDMLASRPVLRMWFPFLRCGSLFSDNPHLYMINQVGSHSSHRYRKIISSPTKGHEDILTHSIVFGNLILRQILVEKGSYAQQQPLKKYSKTFVVAQDLILPTWYKLGINKCGNLQNGIVHSHENGLTTVIKEKIGNSHKNNFEQKR